MAKEIGFKSNAIWPIPPLKASYSPIHIPQDDGAASDDLHGSFDSKTTSQPSPSPSKRPYQPPRLPPPGAIDTTDHIVSVTVGTAPDRKIFHIHASLLHSSSKFLESKAKPEWTKGSATVDLSHQDADAFDIYANWLYQARIFSVRGDDTKREWVGLARAFVLGEELIDQVFKNAVMTAFIGAAQEAQVDDLIPVLPEMVWNVYDATPERSPMRRFLVDVGKSLEKGQLKKLRDELPVEFVLDLVEALAREDTPVRVGGKRKFQTISTLAGNVLVYHREVREGVKVEVGNRFGVLGGDVSMS